MTVSKQFTPRHAFGLALRPLLAGDARARAEIGRAVAAAQHPPRFVPYGDFTVEGWMDGAVLPSAPALQALMEFLQARGAAPEQLGELQTLHATAVAWQEQQLYQPTELSHAYLVASRKAGLSGHQLAARFAEWNEKHPDAPVPQNHVSVNHLLRGNSKQGAPTKSITYALSTITPPLEPSLRALHEQSMRERADARWEKAVEQNDLGGMLHAIRIRLGDTHRTFGPRVLRHAGQENPTGKHTHSYHWQDNFHLPVGHLHTGETLCEPIVTMAKTADAAPNGLSRTIDEPWFTPEKEKAFRQLFARRTMGSHKDYIVPERALGPAPDLRQMAPSLKVTEASLARRLAESHSAAAEKRRG